MTDRRHPNGKPANRFGIQRHKKLRCKLCRGFICWYNPTVEAPKGDAAVCKSCKKIVGHLEAGVAR